MLGLGRLGDIPYQCQDGQCEAQHDISGAGGAWGAGMYSGGTESVTVSSPGYSYSGPSYSVQTNGYSPSFSSPIYGGFTPNYFSNYSGAYPTESVTVSATQTPVQVQANDIPYPTFSPNNFPTLSPNYFSNYSGGYPVESVTVNAPPTPVQVQANDIPYPEYTQNMFSPTVRYPDLPGDSAAPTPQKKAPAAQGGSKGSPAGAGSGGGGQQKPQPQQQQKPQNPLSQIFNFPKNAGQQANQAQRAVTPQQRAALDRLSAAQLASLLRNGNLTPAQQQAAQAALAKKLAAPVAAGGGGLSPQAAQKAAAHAAAAGASPFQAKAAVLPAILIGGVLAAYAVTHRAQISAQYSSVRRRVRRAFA